MKQLLTFSAFLLLSCFTYAQAQYKTFDLYKFKDLKLPNTRQLKIPGYLKKLKDNTASNDFISINNYKPVVILPLDNMPCFVPDVSVVSKMPNRQNIGTPIPIPNVFPQIK